MILCPIGTRPEAIKAAPVVKALRARGVAVEIALTGQHTDRRMMGQFLDGYGLSVDHRVARPGDPAAPLLLSSLVEILAGLGRLVVERRPRLVLGIGDTTTVMGAALAARRGGALFGHVEAGLRAFSRDLPEEEHRICADALADVCFAPTAIAVENLARERVLGRVLLAGNTVLDALREMAPPPLPAEARRGTLVTLHRQETVDDPACLAGVLAALDEIARRAPPEARPIRWPLHPRTRAKAAEHAIAFPSGIDLDEPIGHRDFLTALARARLVVTDSGGVQEEAAILGTPAVVVRDHTERPETIAAGLGRLAGTQARGIVEAAVALLSEDAPRAGRPDLYGDGRAGERIADACVALLAGQLVGDEASPVTPLRAATARARR